MAIASIKSLFADLALATPQQFEDWRKAWGVAAESGSQEPLFVYVKRTGTDSDRFTVFRKKTVACRCGFLLVFS